MRERAEREIDHVEGHVKRGLVQGGREGVGVDEKRRLWTDRMTDDCHFKE